MPEGKDQVKAKVSVKTLIPPPYCDENLGRVNEGEKREIKDSRQTGGEVFKGERRPLHALYARPHPRPLFNVGLPLRLN